GSDAQAGVIYVTTKKGSGQEGFSGSAGALYKNNFYFDEDNTLVQPYVNLNYGWDGGYAWLGSSFEYGYGWLSPYTLTPMVLPEGTVDYKVKNEREDYINFDIYGGVNIDISDNHNFEVTTKYQQETTPIKDMDTTVEESLFRKVMGNIDYTWYALDNLDVNLSTGISYDEENRTSHNQRLSDYYIFNDNEAFAAYYLNDIFTLKGGYTLDVQYFQESADKAYAQQNHAVFFGGDADIDTVIDINVTAGLRYQLNLREASGYTDTDPIHSLSPEFGIVVKPIDMIAVKANVGHSFKVPELVTAFRDYFDHSWFYVGPNPDLQPESSWGYSGAIEVYPLDNMSFSAGIFRNDLENLIDYDYNTGIYYNSLPVYTPVNIGQAYTWGVNASANAAFQIPVFGELRYAFNFEYLIDARQVLDESEQYVDSETGELFNPRLENRPEYSVSGSLAWNKQEWGTSLKVSGYYFAPAYIYEEQSDGSYTELKTPAMTSLDLRIGQEIPPVSIFEKLKTIVYFEVKNILNSVYDSDGDGDTDRPERQFVIGFTVDF
ncbi:MAG: TonB-dependent receptor, partial [Spirochaetales bacterium]